MMEAKSRNSLSNFSDDILHRILSFLEFEDIARLRVVSTRFQTLSISTPSFSLSSPRYPNIILEKNYTCLSVFNFMNTLHRQRPRDLKIDRLSFSSPCLKHEHHKLHMQWLNKLFQAFCVDDLSLDCELPLIFTSLSRFQSLKVLKLIISLRVSVKLPEMKLASLERLHMERIETQDSVGVWISQSFPSLKSLVLSRVHTLYVSRKQLDLTIRSSCLEDLTIEYCCSYKPVRIIAHNLRALSCTNGYDERYIHDMLNKDEVVVEVYAPNLQSLMWEGYHRRLRYDKSTFKNLHVATLTHVWFFDLNLVEQLFEAIRWAGILRMDSCILENLYRVPLISFGNVRHLEIQFYSTFFIGNNVCDVLTTSLERMSNLETLGLAPTPTPYYTSRDKAPDDPFSFKDALRGCKKTKWTKIRGLKKVKVTIGDMCYSIAFLMGMLKKSCVDMEEMTLSYPSRYHKSLKCYLNCLESASSALSINFNTPN